MTESAVLVRVAESAVAGAGKTLTTVGLGSCVAVLLHDPRARVGGMAHVLLPEPFAGQHERNRNPSKFATTAVPLLAERMCAAGASLRGLEARLVGGASMFAALMNASTLNMGERNIAASREVLARLGIPIRAEHVGGDFGRSVRFEPADGRVVVSTVGRGEHVL
ncbi:MAG: chemotaxis protein CheD [Gemmatimonadota bacterium]|nr:chemotaxis protein CheD [Gemmatimonadota bacterium]